MCVGFLPLLYVLVCFEIGSVVVSPSIVPRKRRCLGHIRDKEQVVKLSFHDLLSAMVIETFSG